MNEYRQKIRNKKSFNRIRGPGFGSFDSSTQSLLDDHKKLKKTVTTAFRGMLQF